MEEKQQKLEPVLRGKGLQDEITIIIRNGKVIKFDQRVVSEEQQGLFGEGI